MKSTSKMKNQSNENEYVNDKNTRLIRKFNYQYKDSCIDQVQNGPRKPTAVELTYMNRLNDLENQNQRVNSSINDLKEINGELKKKINKYLILMQAKDIRYDNLDTKQND